MAYSLLVHTAKGAIGSSTVTTDALDTSSVTLLIAIQSGYQQIPVLSDSKTNTWSPRTAKTANAASRISYCVNPTVGSGHTFTSAMASTGPSLAILGFSGNATVPYDVENGATGSGTTIQPGSVTPSEADELVIAGLCSETFAILSINSGFTISDQIGYVAGQGMGLGAAYLIQGAAGAVNPTWTGTISASSLAATIATFKMAAAGGVVTVPRRMLSGIGA